MSIKDVTNISLIQWAAGGLFMVLVAMASFSGSQIVKAIEDSNKARKEENEKQEQANKALSAKMDLILAQQAEGKTEIILLKNENTNMKGDITTLKQQVMELQLINARNGKR